MVCNTVKTCIGLYVIVMFIYTLAQVMNAEYNVGRIEITVISRPNVTVAGRLQFNK